MSELLDLKFAIKTEAARLGFSHFGVTASFPVPNYAGFQSWIENGFHAGMNYLSRPDSLAKRHDLDLIVEGCQTVISLALPYRGPASPPGSKSRGFGRVSAYARTEDYHKVIWDRLSRLEAFIRQKTKRKVLLKSYVDTGPVLERSFASQAGIGIAGKNTCLIIQGAGSYFFLAEVLTDLPLPTDEPFTRDLCGSCQRCIDACPTGCIHTDRTIDANFCISALTIEQRGVIPDDKKPLLGDWLFGCDACQLVCPHNSRKPDFPFVMDSPQVPEFPDLLSLFSINHDDFTACFGQTPLNRTKREGILRNAAIVLGNQRFTPALPVLRRCLQEESDPGLVDACRWAVREIESSLTEISGKEEGD